MAATGEKITPTVNKTAPTVNKTVPTVNITVPTDEILNSMNQLAEDHHKKLLFVSKKFTQQEKNDFNGENTSSN